MQTARNLLYQIDGGTLAGRVEIDSAHALAALVETEETKYRNAVGDPHAAPSLRTHYAIGKVLSAIKVMNGSNACRVPDTAHTMMYRACPCLLLTWV